LAGSGQSRARKEGRVDAVEIEIGVGTLVRLGVDQGAA
jgi:hypothetical protein